MNEDELGEMTVQLGEMTVQMSIDGRRVTLDPIRTKQLVIPAREIESTALCGFRATWLSGDADKGEFELTAGAGLGSRWLAFDYAGRSFCVDVEDILRALLAWADEPTE